MSSTIQDERRYLAQRDAMVELYDLDYSALAGSPGNPSFMAHFYADAKTGAPAEVALNGVAYYRLPINIGGAKIEANGPPPRPRLEVSNANSIISTLLDSLGYSLKGAKVTRRRIYARHLDGGSDPDTRMEWTPETWIVERKISHSRFMIEFELSAPHDIEGLQCPKRTAESTLCPWTYLDPMTCGWVRGTGGLYFDALGQPSDSNHDECGLTYEDCKLRFGGTTPKTPLRFGGFPALGRIFR